MINRKELRKRIPRGYCYKIAEKAGVTAISVSKYFAGLHNSERIENAALEVIAELNKEKKQLLKAAYE